MINPPPFREKVLDWVADKTPEDRELATNIVSSIIDEASKARVSVVQTGEGIALGNE